MAKEEYKYAYYISDINSMITEIQKIITNNTNIIEIIFFMLSPKKKINFLVTHLIFGLFLEVFTIIYVHFIF